MGYLWDGKKIPYTSHVIILKPCCMNITRTFIIAITGILFFACEKDSNSSAAPEYNSGTGTGGSLARFTIVGNYLYIADHSMVNIYDISDPASPVLFETEDVGFGVETIFPYK